MAARPSPPDFVEYVLRSTTASNLTHNVMILNAPNAELSKFTVPVRLIRDHGIVSDEEEEAANKQLAATAGRGTRKRTRIVKLESEDEVALREQESRPWVLEDFDGQHTFVGRLEGGQTSNYVFFVNQGNEFHVIPASKWYRFTPKLAFQPLSIDEAEDRMTKQRHNTDRWFMHRRAASSKEAPREEGEETNDSKGVGEPTGAASAKRLAANRPDREEIDFDDIFDDDDEGGVVESEEFDPSMPKPGGSTEPSVHRLSSTGKRMRKLFRNLDKATYLGSEEEEDADPYADVDLDEPEPEPKPKAVPGKVGLAPPKPALQPAASPTITLSPAKSAQSKAQPAKRHQLDVPSPEKRLKEDTSLISEVEIVAILRESPLRTRELINRVKAKIKADPANKDVFREIVKRVAQVRGGTEDDDRILELKPEFR